MHTRVHWTPLFLAGLLALPASAAAATTCTVTSTYDAVPTQQAPPVSGTLRYCVETADPADSDDTTIEFAIAGAGPHTINIKTCLTITESGTTVAGFTQSGASAASSNADAVYKIVLDGTDNTCGSILALEGDDGAIEGLRLENQAGFAIEVGAQSATVKIVGNSFDDDGGAVEIAAGASEVTIGGATPADRNVITGSTSYDAILVNGGEGHSVTGNHVLDNAHVGILVSSGATSSGEIVANVVSGNAEGMRIASPGWVVRENLVGWDTDGSTPRGNTGMGIHVDTSGSEDADPVTIGGESGGDSNRVANNGDYGIALWLNAGDATVEHNEVAANGQAGIFYTGGGSSGAIRANTVAGNTSFGIQALDSSPVIDANDVTENGDAGIMAMWTTGGFDDLTIQANTSSENQTSGIWLFGAHATLLDNEVEDNPGGGIFVMSNPGPDPSAEATEDDVVAKVTIGSPEHPNVISGNDGGIMILEALVWNRYRLETENTLTGNTSFAAVEGWFGLARAADAEGEPISGATIRVFASFQDPNDEEEEPFWAGLSDEDGIAGPDGFSVEDVFTWGVVPSFMLIEDGAGGIQRLTGWSHLVRVEPQDADAATYSYPWNGYKKPGCTMTAGVCRYQFGETLEPYEYDAPVPLAEVLDEEAEVWTPYSTFFSSYLGGPAHASGQPGELRSYSIFSPVQCRGPSSNCPAVIVLHGGGGTGEEVNYDSGPDGNTWMDKARNEGFVLVLPDALSTTSGTWNAAHCCGDAFVAQAQDVNFITSLVDDLSDGLDIDVDKERIYLAGMSNGAMLAHVIAAGRPHCFAAVATVAGTVGGYDKSLQGEDGPAVLPGHYSGHHVPILMIHGQEDVHVNYFGADSVAYEDYPTRPRYDLSQQASVEFWLGVNNADDDPVEDEQDYYSVRAFPPNSGGAPVYHVTITDPGPTLYELPYGYAGHAWPGGRCVKNITATEYCENGPPGDVGDPPTPPDHLSAVDAIWTFFDVLTSANENFPVSSCRCYVGCMY